MWYWALHRQVLGSGGGGGGWWCCPIETERDGRAESIIMTSGFGGTVRTVGLLPAITQY